MDISEKYLLYIDILGFSDLVRSKAELIPDLFEAINSLNVHRHHAFKALAFSDTIIAYNSVAPRTEHDHQYLVMYACEFAQDLMYRTVSKEIFFEAF